MDIIVRIFQQHQRPMSVKEISKELLKEKIIGGLDLGEYYPELAGHMLVCVTEKRTKAEIDALVAGLEALK